MPDLFKKKLSETTVVGKKIPTLVPFEQEVPKLKIVELSGEEFMQGLREFLSCTNEYEMIVEAAVRYAAVNLQAEYRVLSVGCGEGLFDQPFLRQLSLQKKQLDFVGVDPNEAECASLEEKCQAIAADLLPKHKFDWQIYPTDFLKFESRKKFDIIFFVQVLYYFSPGEIESAIWKAYDLLNEGGMLIIINDPLLGWLAPHACIMKRLRGRYPSYSEDIQLVLNQCQLLFERELIDAQLNLTACCQPVSELNKKMLSFILGVNVEYFSSSQLQLLREFFSSISFKKNDGETISSHPIDLLCVKKNSSRW
ncbi:MAG: class I SAM-dependent methyltransferase [Hormoscilla sp.]